jgi:alpha-D-ribose 1-methylphosphonate 5-triphosphate synthase subunit PhnG
MMTTTRPLVGQRVELGRYTISAGERVLFGQRVNGVVRVTDKPVRTGRSFLVERGLTSNAELRALVDDYIEQSERRDEPAAMVRVGDALAGLAS